MSKLTHFKKMARRRRTKHSKLPSFNKQEMKERFEPGKVKNFKKKYSIKGTEVVVCVDKNNAIYDIVPRVAFDYLHGTPFNREFVEEVIKNRI